jgi:hypothetical protein
MLSLTGTNSAGVPVRSSNNRNRSHVVPERGYDATNRSFGRIPLERIAFSGSRSDRFLKYARRTAVRPRSIRDPVATSTLVTDGSGGVEHHGTE